MIVQKENPVLREFCAQMFVSPHVEIPNVEMMDAVEPAVHAATDLRAKMEVVSMLASRLVMAMSAAMMAVEAHAESAGATTSVLKANVQWSVSHPATERPAAGTDVEAPVVPALMMNSALEHSHVSHCAHPTATARVVAEMDVAGLVENVETVPSVPRAHVWKPHV